MAFYTWVVEGRATAKSPFRVHDMGTEESGLSIANYLAHKYVELHDECELDDPNVKLTAHQW